MTVINAAEMLVLQIELNRFVWQRPREMHVFQ